MELAQLGAIGELVGGVAVLVTLIYLAVQVRHARDQVNEQSVATALETMQEAFDPVYEGRHSRQAALSIGPSSVRPSHTAGGGVGVGRS